jgi:hypothetical protein
LFEIAILLTVLRRICLMESETEMSNRSYGPWLAGDAAAGDCSRRRRKGRHSEKVRAVTILRARSRR